jgi:conjugative transposon TraM protein
MQLNLKQPKYVMPLLALPFLCLFFYVFHSSASNKQKIVKQTAGLNGTVGDVSVDVKKKDLSTKLDAFRNTYKETDGASAVTAIPSESSTDTNFIRHQNDQRQLDSINNLMRARFNKSHSAATSNDQALANALSAIHRGSRTVTSPSDVPVSRERDPMEMFKQQMAYMDSINKANDPANKAEMAKKLKSEALAKEKAAEVNFSVTKAGDDNEGFNTIKPEDNRDFIKAIIDENVTGYAGSRLRIRLLDDIRAGEYIVPKGTYLYALVTGFSGQRITLAVQSIMSAGKIFPVKLQIYDLDGMPGLYVPESAFRDFTKDVSGNTIQGVSIDGNSTGNQFIMSSVDKIFQSTSTAITDMIRKNKAKLKYSSYIYLIDADALQKEQSHY